MVRQREIEDADGRFVAQVDVVSPPLGLFVELHGEHHSGHPVCDARRETAVMAATHWLCGRFIQDRGRPPPLTTVRRLGQLADQARRRPAQ